VTRGHSETPQLTISLENLSDEYTEQTI
jgi:hypothetical protein